MPRQISKHRLNAAAARYIAQTPSKQILAQIARHAPSELIKIISNAALNVLRGSVYINPHDIGLLRKKRRLINLLASKQISLHKKRRLVQSGRGIFALLPILLSTALSAFGSRFFANQTSND